MVVSLFFWMLYGVRCPAWDVLCDAQNLVAQGGFQNGAALLADLHAAFDSVAVQAGENPAEVIVLCSCVFVSPLTHVPFRCA